MKCIRNAAKDEIKRVEDSKASEIIANGKGWAYCSKGLWKSVTRPDKSMKPIEPIKSGKKDTEGSRPGDEPKKASQSGKKYSRQNRQKRS